MAIRWIAFPLHPETPQEGRSLEDLFAGRGYDIPKMLAQMRLVADAEGLPFGDRHHTYNSRLAQELGKWAETQGAGDAFHHKAFRAYFADGKNLALQEVLLDLAENSGLSRDEALDVLENRTYADAVDGDWEMSRRMGVTAVPTFHFNGSLLVGAQQYSALSQLVSPGAEPPRRNLF